MFLLVLALLVFPCAGLEGTSLPHRLLISDLKIDLFLSKVSAIRNRQDLVTAASPANFYCSTTVQECRTCCQSSSQIQAVH